MAATTQSGSAGSAQNYTRLVSTFGPTSTTVTDRAPFVANDVFDKVATLATIALVAGVGSAIANPSPGLIFVALIAALGFGLVGIFRPARANVFAPLYAIAMGAVLGSISRFYSNGNGAVVPLAILGTTAIFFGVLVAYRTGLVRVTHRFVQVTLIAMIGLLAMMLAVWLGLTIPYTSRSLTSLVVFGVLYLFIAVMNLFVDFNYVYMAQRAGVSKEGEWFAALSIMFSLVMVYLALLRILGSRR
ncbi:MAG TPA: Bax inhibitor-1/YccA family protein [Acidimicrobiales bacterium]|nr:Bax inhibitor-1/YccA family protein [Acidimicrobiales bacterium]